MTATTLDRRPPLGVLSPAARFVLAVIVATVLLVSAFVIGRASAPTHTLRSIISVPAATSHTVVDACRIGRPC